MSLNSYIDFSTYSLLTGLVTFVVIFALTYYLFSSFLNEETVDEETKEITTKFSKNTGYIGCAVIALFVGLLSMVVYKKYLEYKGTTTVSSDPFYT